MEGGTYLGFKLVDRGIVSFFEVVGVYWAPRVFGDFGGEKRVEDGDIR